MKIMIYYFNILLKFRESDFQMTGQDFASEGKLFKLNLCLPKSEFTNPKFMK